MKRRFGKKRRVKSRRGKAGRRLKVSSGRSPGRIGFRLS